MKVAILGYGTVGSGVAKVLADLPRANKKLRVVPQLKYIVELREVPETDPFAAYVIKDSEVAFSDPEVTVVVETIGGCGIAYKLTKAALQAGKSVVTSNKALVADHGPELLALASEMGVRYLFEASVGGGIPILRPLKSCLAANEITCIAGILNGTTNYVLMRMETEGVEFEDALAEASAKGYAELDPTADIEGHDTARKIAILCSVAYGYAIPYTAGFVRGITMITPHAFRLAEQAGYVIKLLAVANRDEEGRIGMKTAMHLVPKDDLLSAVHGVTNAIQVTGSAVGDAMFSGPGAGSVPTASAVVADIIDILNTACAENHVENWEEFPPELLIPEADLPVKALLVPLTIEASAAQQKRLEELGTSFYPKIGAYGAFEIGVKQALTEGELARLKQELTETGKWLTMRIFRTPA